MNRLNIAITVAVLVLSPLAAQAAEKTVVLNVDNATCEACGPIVKKSLSRIEGVKSVQIAEAGSSAVATVTFDDTRADIPKLIDAVTNAGYPAHIKN